MITFPCCKINLGLKILDKRTDGYHNIASVFYPVPLFDAIEILNAEKNEFLLFGNQIAGDKTDNLVFKAHKLLEIDFKLPPVQIILLKNIPSGAGLGGGSSDGVFALKLISDFFDLKLNKDQIHKYAIQLGSDCPFFVEAKPALVEGRGDIINAININLKGLKLVLIFPELAINTSEAFYQYSKYGKQKKENDLSPQLFNDIKVWKEQLVNDFEGPIFESYPKLREIKDWLYSLGAIYASMSGSGSTIFGIFDHAAIEKLKLSIKLKNWNYHIVDLD